MAASHELPSAPEAAEIHLDPFGGCAPEGIRFQIAAGRRSTREPGALAPHARICAGALGVILVPTIWWETDQDRESEMLDGVMLLWFLLTAAALLFVAIDICSTPESPVLKWGFLLVTAYTGVVGAFLYVLGCREPLPGLHERYVAARWRQTLGSTMHCVAGDGVGILAGAVISSVAGLTGLAEVILEYVLGFAFGWMIFQALFMRDTAGGSYKRALTSTFVPELLSMNLLMAGMVPTAMILKAHIQSARD